MVSAAAALLASALMANAATVPGFDRFKLEVGQLATWGTNGGEWIAMMPAIAADCDMRISKAQLGNVAVRFPDQLHTSVVAQRMANGFPNPFKQDWDVMFSEKPDRACAVAVQMWGDDGELFPGVLVKP